MKQQYIEQRPALHIDDRVPPHVVDAWNRIANDPANKGKNSFEIREKVLEEINKRHNNPSRSFSFE